LFKPVDQFIAVLAPDDAGRFGVGLNFQVAPQFDLGGELGTIHKKDVGILGSANLSSISIDWPRKGKNGIPFSSAAYQRRESPVPEGCI
jgi:hypothetical protein